MPLVPNPNPSPNPSPNPNPNPNPNPHRVAVAGGGASAAGLEDGPRVRRVGPEAEEVLVVERGTC